MRQKWVYGIFGVLAAISWLAGSAEANVLYRVRMNTHTWNGKQGYVVIAMTSGLKGTTGSTEGLCIRNFVNDGYRGTASITGGGQGGDLVYRVGQSAAACTALGALEVAGLENMKYFYSHVIGNFAWQETSNIDVPAFGDSVRFELELPLPTVGRSSFQDQFYVQVLDTAEASAFATTDPFGTNAICAFTAPPSGGGPWVVETFSPATLTPAQGSDPATINITFPDPTVGVGDLGTLSSDLPSAFTGVTPNPSLSDVRLQYSIQRGPADTRLAIYDLRGRLLKCYKLGLQPSGAGAVVWDRKDDAGRSVGPGVYFARLTIGAWKGERKVLLLR